MSVPLEHYKENTRSQQDERQSHPIRPVSRNVLVGAVGEKAFKAQGDETGVYPNNIGQGENLSSRITTYANFALVKGCQMRGKYAPAVDEQSDD